MEAGVEAGGGRREAGGRRQEAEGGQRNQEAGEAVVRAALAVAEEQDSFGRREPTVGLLIDVLGQLGPCGECAISAA